MATSSKRKKSSSTTSEKHREASPIPPEKPTEDRKSKRVFSKEDEIHLLKVFLDIIKDSPSPATAASSLWDRVGTSLSGEITQTQLIEKLRKLRQKYSKQIVDESLIKTPHERVLLEISHKVWGENPSTGRSMASPSPKKAPRTTAKKEKETLKPTTENHTPSKTLAAATDADDDAVVEVPEEGELDLEKKFSFLIEEVSRLPENLGMRGFLKRLKVSELGKLNARWRQLQIAEAKLLVQRTELIQEQTKLVLECLESKID